MDLDLDQLVAKMRELGITEYRNGDIHIVLGAPKVDLEERDSETQQRIRDERERRHLQHKQDLLYRASWGIGPPREKIK